MSNFKDVGDFHRKFGLPYVCKGICDHDGRCDGRDGPHEVSPEIMHYRLEFLAEELDELREGVDEGDHAKMADALVDLVYVAMGTAHFLGYPWQDLWDEVQAANMKKARAKADGSDSKRRSGWDVIKPDGWKTPDIVGVLKRHGFL